MKQQKERSKLRKWCGKQVWDAYRWYSRKIAFPRQYMKYSKYPVDERKVVFVEIRFPALSNSMSVIRDRFAASDNYDVHEWYLRQDYTKFWVQYRVAMDCIKDMATARYVVICEGTDVVGCVDVRPETYVLQTWHGCGAIKKCGLSTADMKFGRDMKTQMKYPLFRNFDMVTVASPEHIWVLEDAMGLKGQDKVKPIGISRSDVFFDESFFKDARKHVQDAIPNLEKRKIILYAPTFRGEMNKARSPESLDLGKMAEALADEYVLLVKHHPLVRVRPEIPEGVKDKFVYDVTDEISIEELIAAADICILDYSSVVFEFSLFEKPMVFFAPDRAEYADERGMYYKYEDFVPGPIFDDTASVIEWIEDIDASFDRGIVKAFKDKYMSSCDGHSTERILDVMGANV